jgi:hypothetical protein
MAFARRAVSALHLCLVVACGSGGGSDATDAGADASEGDAAEPALDAEGLDAEALDAETSESDASLDAALELDGNVADAVADAGADTALDHKASLAALGVDTTLAPYPAGPNGLPLPSGYHPLGRAYTTLDQRDEILYLKRGAVAGRFYDDVATLNAKPILAGQPRLSSDAWQVAEDEAAIAADIDGDGRDEVVVFYYEATDQTLSLYTIEHLPDNTFAKSAAVVIDTGLTKLPAWDWFEDGVTAANLDDDAAEELVIGFGKVYMLDDGDAVGPKFARLNPVASAGLALPSISADRIDVGVGDLDNVPGDLTDEVVITHNSGSIARVEIFDGTTHIASKQASFELNGASTDDHSSAELRVEVGNFDKRDPEDEIVFLGYRLGYDWWTLTLMDGKSGNFGWYRSFSRYIADTSDGRVSIQLRRIDVDGDHVDEVFADFFILSEFDKLPASDSDAVAPEGGGITSLAAGNPFNVSGFPLPSTGRVKVASVGNVVQTRAAAAGQQRAPVEEELVAIEQFGRLVYGGVVNGAWSWREIEQIDGASNDTLVLGNFDDDSATVHFRNEHEVLYSSPKPIALLSAPPFHAADSGVQQPTGNTYTAFGTSTTMGVNTSQSMSLSVGWSVGFEGGIAGLAKVESSLSFEQKFDSVTSSGLELAEWITYATGAEDSVVFTSVPFDVYYYDIVASPVAADVGKTISINVPRRPQTSLVSAAFYDLNRGPTPAVAPLFTHTVGRPRSYPSEAQRDSACAANLSCYSSQVYTVGEGGGFTEIYISKTTNQSKTTNYNFSVTAESKLTVGGVSLGHSVGFGYGFGMGVTSSETTSFTGRVANIVGRTPADAYDLGLFARQVPFGDGDSKVMLVDYWVK